MITVIELPSLSSTMKKGKVVKWRKKEGDFVRKDETLFEVQTDKVNVEVDSPVTGFMRKILLPEGVEAAVHTPIAIISGTMEEDISSALAAPLPAAAARIDEERAMPESEARLKISPLARRVAEEAGIDVHGIRGTGPGGRITREDVEKAVAQRSIAPALAAVGEKGPAPSEEGGYRDIEMTEMRKVIARRLQESKANAPHFYVDLTADASSLIRLKEGLDRNASDGKISLNDILIKIVARALKEFPMVNASLLGDRIRVQESVHIGVAVAVEDGLVVPVIRNADRKSFQEIGREAKELAAKARNKRLLPQEYEGGTFTITNMGMFGVETFHAIINPPQSGILAIGAVIPKPIVVDGGITVRPCLKFSLSVDHRVVDGALAARFLAYVRELVECPGLLVEK